MPSRGDQGLWWGQHLTRHRHNTETTTRCYKPTPQARSPINLNEDYLLLNAGIKNATEAKEERTCRGHELRRPQGGKNERYDVFCCLNANVALKRQHKQQTSFQYCLFCCLFVGLSVAASLSLSPFVRLCRFFLCPSVSLSPASSLPA